VFADAESRDRLLQAAQEALDCVIDEEDAKA
jgi:predicted RNase H-like HicB family nuclease